MNRSLQERLAGFRVYRILHGGGNSTPRVEAAVRAGIEAVEADLWLHRGRLVTRHAKAVGWLPVLYDRFRLMLDVRTPVLEQVARLAADKVHLHLDLKSPGEEFCRRVLDLLRRLDLVSTASLSSQNWNTLEAVERQEPSLRCYFSIGRPEQWREFLRLRDLRRIHGISVHHSLLSEERVRELHGHGIRVNAWTVDQPERALQLLEWGVDGLVSNSMPLLAAVGPQVMLPALTAESRQTPR